LKNEEALGEESRRAEKLEPEGLRRERTPLVLLHKKERSGMTIACHKVPRGFVRCCHSKTRDEDGDTVRCALRGERKAAKRVTVRGGGSRLPFNVVTGGLRGGREEI